MPTALPLFPVFSVNFYAISLWATSLRLKQLLDISVSSASPISPNPVPAMDCFSPPLWRMMLLLVFLIAIIFLFLVHRLLHPVCTVCYFSVILSWHPRFSVVLVFGSGRDGDDSSGLGWVWEELERLRGRERGYGFRINILSLNNTLYFPRVSRTNSLVTLSRRKHLFFSWKQSVYAFKRYYYQEFLWTYITRFYIIFSFYFFQ